MAAYTIMVPRAVAALQTVEVTAPSGEPSGTKADGAWYAQGRGFGRGSRWGKEVRGAGVGQEKK